eukprot:jgi/Bigna1/85207/estExt_fgenesh1_pg.C_20426
MYLHKTESSFGRASRQRIAASQSALFTTKTTEKKPHIDTTVTKKDKKGGAQLLGDDEKFVHLNKKKLNIVTSKVWRSITKKKAQLHLEVSGDLPHRYRAAKDPLIDSVFLTVKPLPCGFARVEELISAIRIFRSTKKRIIAFVEMGAEKEIAVASACTEFLFSGLGEKAGIKAEVFQRGKYKGGHALAADWKDGKGLPQEVRERSRLLREDMRARYIDILSQSLEANKDEISEIISKAPSSASDLVECNLLTGVLYKDQVMAKIMVWVIDDKSYRNVSSTDLGLSPKKDYISRIFLRKNVTPGIAVVPVLGTIQDGKGGRRGTVASEPMIEALEALAKRKDVDAAVLRIDSPGGSALASDAIWRSVCLLGKQMPVVASMGDVAASGGYYIAMGAEEIFASSTTVTGSIGVITFRLSFEKLFKRLQIWAQTDPGKDPYSAMSRAIYRPLNMEEHERVDGVVQSLYDEFVRKVGDCRNFTSDQVARRAEGRVFTGFEAKENGLVDNIGGLTDAIQSAAELIGEDSWTKCNLIPVNVGKTSWLNRFGLQTLHATSLGMSQYTTEFEYIKQFEEILLSRGNSAYEATSILHQILLSNGKPMAIVPPPLIDL